MNELAELAKLDGLVGNSAKKQESSMASAVSKTEKIRDWVRSSHEILFEFFL
jgi:hypothetical protein